jgi:hypothetical protein
MSRVVEILRLCRLRRLWLGRVSSLEIGLGWASWTLSWVGLGLALALGFKQEL